MISERGIDSVYVYTYCNGEPLLAGAFSQEAGHGAFVYHPDYAAIDGATCLDPINLSIGSPAHLVTENGGVPGAFLDSCPQEWGMRLLNVMVQAAREDDPVEAELIYNSLRGDPKALMLLGSGYGTGNIRFSVTPDQYAETLEPTRSESGIASLADLPRLAGIIRKAEQMRPLTPQEKALILPGASMGGARPKALISIDGEFWMAKFRAIKETVDIQRVEHAINFLALHAGIECAESRAVDVEGPEGPEAIFLTKRFDRSPSGKPLSYLSAATLLGAPRAARANQPAADLQAAFSYPDIASVIRRVCVNPREDIQELYRRMVFNAAIGNTDDHLCNHGFLESPEHPGRYRLAPAFDLAITPNLHPEHAIGIRPADRRASPEALDDSARRMGLPATAATEIRAQVAEVVSQWDEAFTALGVSAADMNWVAPCISTSRVMAKNKAPRAVASPRKQKAFL